MQHVYSPELIERCRRIFEKRSGKAISADEAVMHLEKLARLGLLMTKFHAMQKNKSLSK